MSSVSLTRPDPSRTARARRTATSASPRPPTADADDTLGDDGLPVEALVLMCEPAIPCGEVEAWPIAVLHLATQDRTVDEVLCVAEAAPFTDLVDLADLPAWHAQPEAWAKTLARLTPGSDYPDRRARTSRGGGRTAGHRLARLPPAHRVPRMNAVAAGVPGRGRHRRRPAGRCAHPRRPTAHPST
ncbi:inorganic diphosphatase [Streptomyces shenzhenensis]|uniref:inorganic diphosphatase n=1 Tax=Streptomyces shenzhenensis TaxID=943815 RepID=UPI003D8C87E2